MLLLADPKQPFHAQVRSDLGNPNGHLNSVSLKELPAVLGSEDGVEAIILGPNFALEDALAAASLIQDLAPHVGIVLITPEISSDLLHTALRSGIRDVLPADFKSTQLQEAVSRAEEFSRHLRKGSGSAGGAGGSAKVITVFSTKGGTGKSIVASNLSVLLAETGESVAVVDLDLQSADFAMLMQLMPKWTIHDAATKLTRLDVEALAGYLTPHRSGVKLLAGPREPAQSDEVSAEAVTKIVGLLKETHDYVIVDCPGLFTEPVLAALDVTDECVLVGSMDIPSIKNLKLGLQTLGQLGLDRERIHTVVNRAHSNVGLEVPEIESVLHTGVDVAIPSSRDVPVAVNRGTPVALHKPKSPVVAALRELADRVKTETAAEAEASTPSGRKSLFGRVRGS